MIIPGASLAASTLGRRRAAHNWVHRIPIVHAANITSPMGRPQVALAAVKAGK